MESSKAFWDAKKIKEENLWRNRTFEERMAELLAHICPNCGCIKDQHKCKVIAD